MSRPAYTLLPPSVAAMGLVIRSPSLMVSKETVKGILFIPSLQVHFRINCSPGAACVVASEEEVLRIAPVA